MLLTTWKDFDLGAVASQDDAILWRQAKRRGGERVVLVHGCFDLLHPGHIRLIEEARSLGDALVVAVESDANVRARTNANAGARDASLPARPITPAAERMEILAALEAVDLAFEPASDTPSEWLARLAPDVIAAGAETPDRASHPAAFRSPIDEQAAAAIGAKFTRIPLEPGHSASLLMERIAQLHS